MFLELWGFWGGLSSDLFLCTFLVLLIPLQRQVCVCVGGGAMMSGGVGEREDSVCGGVASKPHLFVNGQRRRGKTAFEKSASYGLHNPTIPPLQVSEQRCDQRPPTSVPRRSTTSKKKKKELRTARYSQRAPFSVLVLPLKKSLGQTSHLSLPLFFLSFLVVLRYDSLHQHAHTHSKQQRFLLSL
jgi:hypothetical protein